MIGSLQKLNVWPDEKSRYPPSKMSFVTLRSQTISFPLACQLDLLDSRNVLLLIVHRERTYSLNQESILYCSVEFIILISYVFDSIVSILPVRTVCRPQILMGGGGGGGSVLSRAAAVLRMETEAWQCHRVKGHGRAMR